MDPRKAKATRGKNHGPGSSSMQPASSFQPNPNHGLPNQFVTQFDFSQFANPQFGNPQFVNPQFVNPQFGFSQFANQGASNMPIQSGYNEFHLNPSPPYRGDEDSDDEEEAVPETQEEEEVQVIPAPSKGKAKSKWWTQEEETALAKAYLNVSEDPVKGDNQTNKTFWKKVLDVFNTHLGVDSGRSHHQVNSKWKDLNNKITAFASMYNKRKSNMSSGMNDEDVLKAAQQEYMKKYKARHGFPHLGAWEVLKNFPKWGSVPTFEEMESSSSKRARTSESQARSFEAEFMPVDLDDEEGDEDEPEQPARPTEPPRRNRKKPVESSTSTER